MRCRFLTNMFQQLDTELQGSSSERLLRDSVCGVVTSELVADGGRFSERDQEFSFLSVDIKDTHDLKSGLEDVRSCLLWLCSGVTTAMSSDGGLGCGSSLRARRWSTSGRGRMAAKQSCRL